MAKQYFEYPNSIQAIAESILKSRKDIEISLDYNTAVSTRHSFYRYARALGAVAAENSHARNLYNTVKNIKVFIRPSSARAGETVSLQFKLDPLMELLPDLVETTPTEEIPPKPKTEKVDTELYDFSADEIEKLLQGDN